MTRAQVSWTVTIVASIIAIGGGAKTFWHDLGWITPAQSEERHQATDDAVKEFRDEWRCEKYEEQLRSLKRRIARMDPSESDYPDLEYDIQRIENKIAEVNCSRFEEF